MYVKRAIFQLYTIHFNNILSKWFLFHDQMFSMCQVIKEQWVAANLSFY